MRLLVLREEKSGIWKTMLGDPSKFDSRKFPGYRYHKSFPNNQHGKILAREYANDIEKLEKTIHKLPAIIRR